MYVEIIKAVLEAFLVGGAAGLMGYMKQEDLPASWTAIFTKEFWAKFEPTKALKTVLVSGIVFAIAFYFGVTPKSVEELGVFILIVYGVDALIKFIVRRTPLVKAWNYVKEKFQAVFGK